MIVVSLSAQQREVLKKLGNPTQNNVFYMTIKALLERIAPVMIDYDSILQILRYVDDSVRGLGEIDDEIGIKGSERGLQLLLVGLMLVEFSTGAVVK